MPVQTSAPQSRLRFGVANLVLLGGAVLALTAHHAEAPREAGPRALPGPAFLAALAAMLTIMRGSNRRARKAG